MSHLDFDSLTESEGACYGAAMSTQKVIKRYANRKLYDTERSCYVTLEDIALMIKAGDDVSVIDNKSGEDLTSVTFAQIIFETEKKNNFMPLSLLRDLIQNKGEVLQDAYRDSVDKVQATAADFKETAQERAQRLKDRAGKIRTNFEEALRKGEKGARAQFDSAKDLLASSQTALDELQLNLEEKVKSGVDVLGREVGQIRKRLAEIEERLQNKSK